MDIEGLGIYQNKVVVLRQIMSDQAHGFKVVNTGAKILTVVISAGLTFMGFTGPTGVAEYVGLFATADPKTIGLIFNLLVLGLFILLTSHLVFHFDDKEAERWRAVVRLSQLANEIDYLIGQSERNAALDANAFTLIRTKYESLIEVLPGNSDKDFLRAKKNMAEKQSRKSKLSMAAPQLFSEDANRRALEALVRQSDLTMSLLSALSRGGERLYLAGGVIRSLVWDHLHEYKRPTPIDDVDVVYFDKLSSSKEHDAAIEKRLREFSPNMTWSAKNQARMHQGNGDAAYESLADALEKWPETATAVAVRVNEKGQFEILAPHGLTDLFRLIVAPTPHFENGKLARYRERVQQKNWRGTWPLLRVFCAA